LFPEAAMTTTVKLPNTLEMNLRQHCAVSGESISEVIRVALEAHLATAATQRYASPAELGAQYFGRFAGPADLSTTYREARAALWDDVLAAKQPRPTNKRP
jgi:Arc/MetJ-type ribon-helix-helix transcriptional regulator